MSDTQTYRDAVAAVFKAQPNVWIDGLALAKVGGAYAWRSRCSDCRLRLGMDIENRIVRLANGTRRSEYRYRPASLLEMAS